jgi:hypothetical protein
VTFESDGDYVLRAEADMAEVVEEVSEINNRGDIDVVVEPAS